MSKVLTRGATTPPPSVQVILVGPAQAQQWLDTRLENERFLRTGRVAGIARDMAEGEFYFIGDPIRFDEGGHLVDGQHRLTAVVNSETEHWFVVINVPDKSLLVIDTGSRRTVTDMVAKLGIATGVKGKIMTAISNKCHYWDLGIVGSRGVFVPTAHESIEYLNRNREALLAATDVAGQVVSNRLPVAASAIGTAWFLTHRIDPAAADEFWIKQVIQGVQIDVGDPAYALRARFQKETAKNRRISAVEGLLYSLQTWNHYRQGTVLFKLQAPRGGFSNRAFALR